jgi:hypothetical protein
MVHVGDLQWTDQSPKLDMGKTPRSYLKNKLKQEMLGCGSSGRKPEALSSNSRKKL